MPAEFVATTCSHDCPSTCALEVERLGPSRIGRVRGAPDHAYTAGATCAKMGRYAERVHHADRLKTPLIRKGAKGDGDFQPLSWDDALDAVAEAFLRAAQAHGPESVWPLHSGGTMGLVQRYSIERLRHVMGYSREHASICVTPAMAGWIAGVGAPTGVNPCEMAFSDLIVLWGTNAISTQVNVMTHVARARKARGAKLVVVDVYRNPTMEAADTALLLKPGTDGALAAAVMQVLLAEGHADRDYLARYTDFDAEAEAHLMGRTPAWAAAITGIPEDEITAFARAYGETERAFLRLGIGFTRQRNGAANLHAVSCLPAVRGAWRHKGAGAFFAGTGRWQLDATLIQGLDRLDKNVRVLHQPSIGAVLTGDKAALKGGPRVTALLMQNFNAAATAPDTGAVMTGFKRDDLFTCVHEQFPTETAALADIVLPATTFLEHDDIYRGIGHMHLSLGPRVIEPQGQARSNNRVVNGLAERLGAEHPGFKMRAWELIDATLKASDLAGADDLKERRWIDGDPGFDEAHFLNGFPGADKRFRFHADWERAGPEHADMPPLPDHATLNNDVDAAHPFRMVTPPARSFLNTSFTETPTSKAREVGPVLLIHPDDARSLALAEGDRAAIGNRQGELRLPARLFDGLRPGVVAVEGVWPNSAFEGGIGINLLLDARPVPPNGGAAFHDSSVWVHPA